MFGNLFHTISIQKVWYFMGVSFLFNRFKTFKNSNLKKNYISIESSHLSCTQLLPLLSYHNDVGNTLLRFFSFLQVSSSVLVFHVVLNNHVSLHPSWLRQYFRHLLGFSFITLIGIGVLGCWSSILLNFLQQVYLRRVLCG